MERKRYLSTLWDNMDEKPIRIVPDKKYPKMYRLQWANGDVSVRYWDNDNPMDDGGPNSYGMYNLTRAKDILKNYASYIDNQRLCISMKDNSLAYRSKTITGEFCESAC
jgi:hypothetical protein